MIEEPQVRSFNCTMIFNYKFVLLIFNFPILDVFTQYLLVFKAIVTLKSEIVEIKNHFQLFSQVF